MNTALTYGVSLSKHKDWKLGRPKLCITEESNDISWGQVVGYIWNQLRGKSRFGYGHTINFKEKISDESKMDAFLIFGPSILDKEDYLGINIGQDYIINITGLYPIYSSEIEKYNELGLEEFWHHPNFDLYKVNRKRIE